MASVYAKVKDRKEDARAIALALPGMSKLCLAKRYGADARLIEVWTLWINTLETDLIDKFIDFELFVGGGFEFQR